MLHKCIDFGALAGKTDLAVGIVANARRTPVTHDFVILVYGSKQSMTLAEGPEVYALWRGKEYDSERRKARRTAIELEWRGVSK